MKRGLGMCSMFKAFNLTYLQVLHAGMVYITLWYVHVPVPQTPIKINFKVGLFYTSLT